MQPFRIMIQFSTSSDQPSCDPSFPSFCQWSHHLFYLNPISGHISAVIIPAASALAKIMKDGASFCPYSQKLLYCRKVYCFENPVKISAAFFSPPFIDISHILRRIYGMYYLICSFCLCHLHPYSRRCLSLSFQNLMFLLASTAFPLFPSPF